MGRKKLEIKKSKGFNIRVELALKKQYFAFCKRNKYILSKRIREFMINDLEKENK